MKRSYIILEKDGRTVIASLTIHGPSPEKPVKTKSNHKR